MGTVVPRSALERLGNELRSQGKKIVSTNGCFDLLHVGHTRILKAARELGDVLIVGLNSDASVQKLKGSSRPINQDSDRAEILTSLDCVDYVTIFDEDTPVQFLELLKPDIHVKGADYKPEHLAETPVVEKHGGQVRILKLVPGKSTTEMIGRMRSE